MVNEVTISSQQVKEVDKTPFPDGVRRFRWAAALAVTLCALARCAPALPLPRPRGTYVSRKAGKSVVAVSDGYCDHRDPTHRVHPAGLDPGQG